MKHRRKTKIAIMVLILVFLMGFPVFADQKMGSIDMDLSVVDPWDKTVSSVEGVEIGIVKVADLTSTDFTLKNPYREDMNLLSDNLEEMLSSSKKVVNNIHDFEYSVVTDGNGSARVSNLEDGAYLICQTGAHGQAAKYSHFEPFVIKIPFLKDGVECRNADISPKISLKPTREPEKEKPKEEEKIKTSDETEGISLYSGMLLISLSLVLYLGYRKKEGMKNE